jgi:hypothetical protein
LLTRCQSGLLSILGPGFLGLAARGLNGPEELSAARADRTAKSRWHSRRSTLSVTPTTSVIRMRLCLIPVAAEALRRLQVLC